MDYAKLVYGRFSDEQEQKHPRRDGAIHAGRRCPLRGAREAAAGMAGDGAREVSTTHPPKAEVEDMLRKYADHWQRPAAERAQIRQANEAGVDLTVTIANLTTPEQKAPRGGPFPEMDRRYPLADARSGAVAGC